MVLLRLGLRFRVRNVGWRLSRINWMALGGMCWEGQELEVALKPSTLVLCRELGERKRCCGV